MDTKKIFSCLFFVWVGIMTFLLVACGGDSGSSVSNDDEANRVYKTYEELISKQTCSSSLKMTIVHVSSTNEDYICSQDASSETWSWILYKEDEGKGIYETFIDSRDGHIYKMVTIGKQTWMAENLDFASDSSACFVNSKTGLDECGLYSRGRFYPWSVAVDSAGIYSNNGKGCGSSVGKYITYGEDCTPIYPMRGVCPQGWHLPDTSEWRTLFNYTNGDVLVKALNHQAEDSYGFSALRLWPELGNKVTEGTAAIFWTSTIIWDNKHTQGLHEAEIFDTFQNLNTSGGTFDHSRKLPIRCIQDNVPNPKNQEEKISSSSSRVVENLSLDKSSSIKVTPLADGHGDYVLSFSGVVKSDDNHKIDSLYFSLCTKESICVFFPASIKSTALLGTQSINLASTLDEMLFDQNEYSCGDFLFRTVTFMSNRENTENTVYVDSLETAFNIKCEYIKQSSNSSCTEMEMVENVSLSTNGQKALNFATGLSSNPDVTLRMEEGYPFFDASSGVKIIQEGSHEPGYIPPGAMCFESFTEWPNGEANPMELDLHEWYLVKTTSATYPFMVASLDRTTSGITITYFKKK